MRFLFLRPVAPNERFGLGPFFKIEPLGLEYIAAALKRDGHEARIFDLRFVRGGERGVTKLLQRESPDVVGIASAHTLDTNEALALARVVKNWKRDVFTLIGGHAASVFPEPFTSGATGSAGATTNSATGTNSDCVDAICCEDGERVVPALARALSSNQPLREVAGLIAREHGAAGGAFVPGPCSSERVSLDEVPLPARDALITGHDGYLCVQRRPVYLVEATRGCPYRCSFCTIWQHVDRSFRCRNVATVVDDLAAVGGNVFFADDLFGHPAAYSEELANALNRWGVKKEWLLLQTRTDLVAKHPALIEKWRARAQQVDIFFGFESPTDAGLAGVQKDSGVAEVEEAIAVCRKIGIGITGNFICDPAWDEDDFRRLWDFLGKHKLDHVGFTVLTPLPGTDYFDEVRPQIRDPDWSHYDMHHLLWEPRLGRRRFFELFAETWRRTALNARGARSLWSYVKQVRPRDIPFVLRVLKQSRRLFDPDAYLAETFPPGPSIPLPQTALARAAGDGR